MQFTQINNFYDKQLVADITSDASVKYLERSEFSPSYHSSSGKLMMPIINEEEQDDQKIESSSNSIDDSASSKQQKNVDGK